MQAQVATTHEARRQWLRLCAAGALAYCSYAMCRSPVLPLFARDLGAGPELVGLVVGASTITGVLLKLPAGAASDIVGRGAMLVAGGVVFASLPFAYLAASTIPMLVVIRFAHGSATAAFGPVAAAALSDVAPPDRRGAWLGWYQSSQAAGQALGPLVAGYLVVSTGFDRSFVVSGMIGVVAFALVVGWPAAAGGSRPSEGHRWTQFRQGVVAVVRDRAMLITSLAQAGQFLLHGSLNGFLPLYAQEELGLDAFQIGGLFGLQVVTTIVARPIFGAVSDRVGRRRMIAIGLATCGAAVAAVSAVSSPVALSVAVAAYGAGVGVTTSAASAHITDLSARTQYGAAHGVFGTIYDVGDAIGPLAGGLLAGALGYRLMFRCLAAVAVVFAAGFVWLSRPPAPLQAASFPP